MRVDLPPYFADIVQDNRSTPALWHCIVQRYGSNDVIAWFQAESVDAARHAALAELEELRRQDLKSAGQLSLTLNPGPDQAA